MEKNTRSTMEINLQANKKEGEGEIQLLFSTSNQIYSLSFQLKVK